MFISRDDLMRFYFLILLLLGLWLLKIVGVVVICFCLIVLGIDLLVLYRMLILGVIGFFLLNNVFWGLSLLLLRFIDCMILLDRVVGGVYMCLIVLGFGNLCWVLVLLRKIRVVYCVLLLRFYVVLLGLGVNIWLVILLLLVMCIDCF